MKLSFQWLQDFVTFTVQDPQEIARRLTACTAEVEHVEVQGAMLSGCCVGKVLTIRKHPNADKLSLCEVQTDRGVKKVVCGGTNLHVGMRVAFAHVGATVKWHGGELQTLENVTIRGEESEGMICTAEELDLTAQFSQSCDRTLIDFGDGDAGIGEPLSAHLGLDDVVFHIDNHAITHRADLFSHLGFARECVAIGLAHWKKKALSSQLPALSFSDDPLPFPCLNEAEHLIPRYCACMIHMDGLGSTPAWMQSRLETTGWRSVSLPVDITNYVMIELGMPLHSFDVADLHGTVRMRTTQEGEWLTTLDGTEHALPEGALIMSDDHGVFDLLGVMGGLRSSTKESTRDIYLHAAVVDPVSVRKTILATGHRTDASTIYEKGIPRSAALSGLLRALELFLELVPGGRITSKLASSGTDGRSKPIVLSLEHMTQMLGTEIPKKQVSRILTDLECTVRSTGTKALTVTPPPHRLGDLHEEHDLIEEIGRVAGFNEIHPVMPRAAIIPPARDRRISMLRDALKEQGYTELVPLSLVGAPLLVRGNLNPESAVAIENPLGEEHGLLTPSALPRLLEHAQRNILHTEDVLHTFSMSHVFEKDGSEWTELACLVTARMESPLLQDSFLLLKRNLRAVFETAGYSLCFRASEDPPLFAHPGRCALLEIQGRVIGSLCEIHPTVRARFDLSHRTAAALLDLTNILTLTPATPVPTPLPTFPAISYDLTTTLSQRMRSHELVERIRRTTELLENIRIVDLYDGKPLRNDQYNLTLRCTYRAKDRTLREEEAQQAHAKVMALCEGLRS